MNTNLMTVEYEAGHLQQLSPNELMQVSGGCPPCVAFGAIEALKWGGAAFAGGFIGAGGYDAYQWAKRRIARATKTAEPKKK